MKENQVFRPGRFAEQYLVENITGGAYPPGSLLPPERRLADMLGVTRPTVREVLQRLASEGWVTIRHGKATVVNNFWETGGMRLLGKMVNCSSSLPESLIRNLLELRLIFIPPAAGQAAGNAPDKIASHLELRSSLEDAARPYTEYDWSLQELMARHSGNPLYLMLLNDFRQLYMKSAEEYFSRPHARRASSRYYENLHHAVVNDKTSVESVAKKAMLESIAIWDRMQQPEKEDKNVSMERMGR